MVALYGLAPPRMVLCVHAQKRGFESIAKRMAFPLTPIGILKSVKIGETVPPRP
jgi:hypothetical protein